MKHNCPLVEMLTYFATGIDLHLIHSNRLRWIKRYEFNPHFSSHSIDMKFSIQWHICKLWSLQRKNEIHSVYIIRNVVILWLLNMNNIQMITVLSRYMPFSNQWAWKISEKILQWMKMHHCNPWNILPLA